MWKKVFWLSMGSAFRLIVGLNPELLGIILLSLKVSGLALVLATCLGLPLGALLA